MTGESQRGVVARQIGRRAARSSLLWGVVFGAYIMGSATGYAAAYPTQTSRTLLAHTFGINPGIAAMIGPANHIDTIPGFTSWRCVGALSLIGAVWGLLLSTRLLRGQEEAGPWELLLAGRTTRRGATGQALLALGGGLAVLFSATAVLAVVTAHLVTPAIPDQAVLFLALAVTASPAMFMALGALTSQLAATRRQAAGYAAAVFAVAYLLRMVADSSADLRDLIWASPLGWVERSTPLAGSRPTALLPAFAAVVVLAAAALVLSGRRDLSASVLPDRDKAQPRVAGLSGITALGFRLARPVTAGWVAGTATMGLVLGLVAQSAGSVLQGSAGIGQILQRLGGRGGGALAYLGLAYSLVATLLALAAAGQTATTREEEATGRLDNLLVGPLSRQRWFTSRLVVALGVLLASSAAATIALWLGAASQDTGIGLWRLAKAGVNVLPPAFLVLGIGALTHALRPRLTSAVAYGVVGWSFLVQMLGKVINANHWIIDTSVLAHMTPAPAVGPNWASGAVIAAAGLAAAALATVCFTRRDLASA